MMDVRLKSLSEFPRVVTGIARFIRARFHPIGHGIASGATTILKCRYLFRRVSTQVAAAVFRTLSWTRFW